MLNIYNIELESEDQLVKWWKQFEIQDDYRLTLSWIPYSEREIARELTRRDNCREALRDHWLEVGKIQPCPLCGRTWDTKGRLYTFFAARRHVLACKGVKK